MAIKDQIILRSRRDWSLRPFRPTLGRIAVQPARLRLANAREAVGARPTGIGFAGFSPINEDGSSIAESGSVDPNWHNRIDGKTDARNRAVEHAKCAATRLMVDTTAARYEIVPAASRVARPIPMRRAMLTRWMSAVPPGCT